MRPSSFLINEGFMTLGFSMEDGTAKGRPNTMILVTIPAPDAVGPACGCPLSGGLAQGLGRCVDQLVGEAMGHGLERLLGIFTLLQGQRARCNSSSATCCD